MDVDRNTPITDPLTGLGLPVPVSVVVLSDVHADLAQALESLRAIQNTVWSSSQVSGLMDEPYPPDLVISAPADAGQGPEMIRALRRKWQQQLVPAVLLLPSGCDDIAVDAYTAGADFVWTPASSVAVLRARVAGLLRLRTVVSLLVQSRSRAKDRVEEHHKWARFLVHDMRNPLAAVTAGLEWLRDIEGLTPEDRSFCEQMSHELGRLSSLVNDLMDLERLNNGSLPLLKQPVNLATLLESVTARFRRVASGRGVGLRISAGSGDHRANIDAKLIERVFENLLSNALRHSPIGEVIDGELLIVDDRIQIAIANAGPAIPEELRERIFEPYVQISGPETRGASGLGLAFCRQVIEAHGGSIRATDRDGRVCFLIQLPRLRPR